MMKEKNYSTFLTMMIRMIKGRQPARWSSNGVVVTPGSLFHLTVTQTPRFGDFLTNRISNQIRTGRGKSKGAGQPIWMIQLFCKKCPTGPSFCNSLAHPDDLDNLQSNVELL